MGHPDFHRSAGIGVTKHELVRVVDSRGCGYCVFGRNGGAPVLPSQSLVSLSIQLVDATHWPNLSASVSKSNVFFVAR